MDKEVPIRADVDPDHTWNAASVFPSIEAWRAEIKALDAAGNSLSRWHGKLGQGPTQLKQILDEVFEFYRRVDVASMYAYVDRSVDTTNQAANERAAAASAMVGKALAAAAFLDPELLEIDEDTLMAWLDQDEDLAIYDHYIRNLHRTKAHVRTRDIEELLGLAADPFSAPFENYSLLTDSDFKFKPAVASDGTELPLTQGTVDHHKHSSDREVRRTSYENYHDLFLDFRNTLASNLSGSIKQNVFLMRARKHESTLDMKLFEDNVPVEVFHNLIDSFRRNIGIWHRYWQVKKKVLGVEKMYPYDIWAPLSKKSIPVPYEQAVDWICDALKPLGDDYISAMRHGCLEDRWIDIYPNVGKTAGAFSYGAQGTYPFIVMSYGDDVLGLGTLAHELGHSMHSYLSWENQPPVYGEYSIFVAEVASNFHQAMLRAHLLNDGTDPALQIGLIEEAMDNFHRYFLIMPTLARFELDIHERIERGEGLTADGMIESLADLYSEAFGDHLEMDRDRVGIRWATFSHLYSDYYVFQYATGISGAHALANRILTGEPGAAEDYVKFLSAGGSMYPLDALRMAGVDLSSPEPVETAFQILAGIVERLDKLTG